MVQTIKHTVILEHRTAKKKTVKQRPRRPVRRKDSPAGQIPASSGVAVNLILIPESYFNNRVITEELNTMNHPAFTSKQRIPSLWVCAIDRTHIRASCRWRTVIMKKRMYLKNIFILIFCHSSRRSDLICIGSELWQCRLRMRWCETQKPQACVHSAALRKRKSGFDHLDVWQVLLHCPSQVPRIHFDPFVLETAVCAQHNKLW